VKHAGATAVHLHAWWEAGLRMTIADNGCGACDKPRDHEGRGLVNMRERMERNGGSFTLRHDGGTVIDLHLPLAQQGSNGHVHHTGVQATPKEHAIAAR